jgi:hypothetical protein
MLCRTYFRHSIRVLCCRGNTAFSTWNLRNFAEIICVPTPEALQSVILISMAVSVKNLLWNMYDLSAKITLIQSTFLQDPYWGSKNKISPVLWGYYVITELIKRLLPLPLRRKFTYYQGTWELIQLILLSFDVNCIYYEIESASSPVSDAGLCQLVTQTVISSRSCTSSIRKS